MTLHEAIKKLLLQAKGQMTAREIADELNKNGWYSKGDNTPIQPNQITARVNKYQNTFYIDRSVSPLQINLLSGEIKEIQKTDTVTKKKSKMGKTKRKLTAPMTKTSFNPISNSDTEILILGTLPGDKSLELEEYYAHPRNRFWKIISAVTDNDLPTTYANKKKLLLNTKIGIWDVADKANRQGSLDSTIDDTFPNDLNDFIKRHKNLKLIAFNGKKSEELFNKYFERINGIKYVSLPSTSPANTHISLEAICKAWQRIIIK